MKLRASRSGLVCLLLLSLAACGGSDDSSAPDADIDRSTTSVDPEAPDGPDPVEQDQPEAPAIEATAWTPFAFGDLGFDDVLAPATADVVLVDGKLVGASVDPGQLRIVDLESGQGSSVEGPVSSAAIGAPGWAVDGTGAIAVLVERTEPDVGLTPGATTITLLVSRAADDGSEYTTAEVALGEVGSPPTSRYLLSALAEGFALVSTGEGVPWKVTFYDGSGEVTSEVVQEDGVPDLARGLISGSQGLVLEGGQSQEIVVNREAFKVEPVELPSEIAEYQQCDEVCIFWDSYENVIGTVDLATFVVVRVGLDAGERSSASKDMWVDGRTVFRTAGLDAAYEGLDDGMQRVWDVPPDFDYVVGRKGSHGRCLIARTSTEMFVVDLATGEPGAPLAEFGAPTPSAFLCDDEFVVALTRDGMTATRRA